MFSKLKKQHLCNSLVYISSISYSWVLSFIEELWIKTCYAAFHGWDEYYYILWLRTYIFLTEHAWLKEKITSNLKIYCLFQVKQNLMSAVHGHQVSFPFFMAFISLLSNIELIKKIYLNATNGSRTTEVTKGVFLWIERLKKKLFIQITLFLYRGILTFCSNDVTNHTFGSGHPIQPLWSFASNRVNFCFSHMCAENSVCSF